MMTYGWMLLVVTVIGGLIFSIVQDQSLEQVSGFEGEEMQVENFGVSSDNNLSLQVLNARRGTVELTNVTVEGEDGMKYTDTEYMEGLEPMGGPVADIGSQESMEILITLSYCEKFSDTSGLIFLVAIHSFNLLNTLVPSILRTCSIGLRFGSSLAASTLGVKSLIALAISLYTRSPTVYKGNPFQIEVGLAWGGDIEDEREL
ncbi:hypothetical protein HRED_10622 [Candidatus Haloredivivus sp. G17]|nr:hypothetical protein HRED_10622 [Candidatus Haloredivivus sp. G17]